MWNSDFSQVGGSIENRLAQFQKDEEMAAFADIAGWREELAELRSGPAYKKMYPHTIRDPKNDPLVPLSTIFDFVETILMHPSTRNALRSLSVWHKANPPEIKMLDPENDPTFPHEASNLIFDFAMWFMLKTGRGPRYEAYLTGLGLATLVVNAEIATARCPQAIQYLKQRAAFSIDFEEMGTHTIFLINVDRL